MASPFAIFRKFRKPMMVAVTLMAIFAFVFLDYVGGRKSGGMGSAEDPVVATSAFGTIHRSELQTMKEQRNMVRRFLTLVLQFRQEALRADAANRQNWMAGFQLQMDAQRLFSIIPPPTDRNVVETRVLAEEARRTGLVVNDDVITQFLNEQGGRLVTTQQFERAMAFLRTPTGQGVPQAMLYDLLRNELLAMRYRDQFTASLEHRRYGPLASPAQRWDYYLRLKRRATVELAPVAAADFVDTIDDPKESVLQAFFDSHKDAEPVPGSPEPGFKIPHKAAFEFFRAEYDKYFDPQAVPDEEVLAYYEKHKDPQYLYSDLDGRSLTEPEEEKAAEKPAPQNDTPTEKPKPVAPKPDDPKKDSAKPDAPPNEPPKPNGSPTDKPRDGAQPKEESPSSQCGDEDPPKAEAPPAADAAKPAAPPQEPSSGAAGGEKPGEAAEPARPQPPPPLPTPYLLPTDVRQGPKPKFDPLWKVEDSIRKTLAAEKAKDAMDKPLAAVREKMREYSSRFADWEARAASDPALKKPQPPDLADVARAAGLTAHHTPLMPRYEADKLPDLGQSTVEGTRFATVAYRSLQLYLPVESQDAEGNRYLFWKTEEQKARVPALTEKAVREEVVRAWKMIQAREKIVARAKSLAAQANAAKASLKESLAKETGVKVSEAGPFSWLTRGTASFGSQGVQPRLSEVEGVVDPGDEFMRAVFKLEVGQTGVAVNRPQTIAYVVRVTALEPSRELLRETFMADSFRTYDGAAAHDIQTMYQAWIQDRLAAARLKWEIQPSDEFDAGEFEGQ